MGGMDEFLIFVGLIGCILVTSPQQSKALRMIQNTTTPQTDAPGSRRIYQIRNPHKIFSNSPTQSKNHSTRPKRVLLLSDPRILKTRPHILNSDANIERTDQFFFCQTKTDANSKLRNDGKIKTGSKSYTYAERGDFAKKLVCKSRAFRHVNEDGVLTREAVDSKSVITNDNDLIRPLNNVQVEDPKAIQVGSVGSTGLAENADKNEAVSVVNTEARDAKASIVSKSKKTTGFLETASAADGKMKYFKGARGVKSWGEEKSQFVTNPAYSVHDPSGKSSGYAVLQLTQNKTTNFEIEI